MEYSELAGTSCKPRIHTAIRFPSVQPAENLAQSGYANWDPAFPPRGFRLEPYQDRLETHTAISFRVVDRLVVIKDFIFQ